MSFDTKLRLEMDQCELTSHASQDGYIRCGYTTACMQMARN